jgi:hypothetical protein
MILFSQENANDEIIKLMPTLSPVDVASAVCFAISVKEGVEVIMNLC